MSTVKATNLQHASASTPNLTLASDGTVSGGIPTPNRNYILNGSFAIAQRGTSFTLSNVQATSYCLDRWQTYRPANPTAITISQQSGAVAAGVVNFVRLQRTASNSTTEVVTFSQSIEILNAKRLAGQSVTFSFYARGGANYSGTLSARVQTGTGSTDNGGLYNVWTGSAFPISQTPALTTSWQRFQYTATFGSSVTQAEVRFDWTPSGTAGAADYLDLSGVQLEPSTVATAFEFKSYGQELRECQRYYYVLANALDDPIGMGANYTATYLMTTIQMPVTMRTTPTLTSASGTDYYTFSRNGADDTFNSFAIFVDSPTSVTIRNNTEISGTAGHAGAVRVNNALGSVAFGAEL